MRLLDYLTGFISLLALPFIVWWGVNQSPQSAASLETRLQDRAAQALQSAGISWASVDMDGQTAILTGPAPSEDAVGEAASIVLRSSGLGGLLFGGVSQVETRVHAAAPVSPFVWTAETLPGGGLRLAGHVPSNAARAALRQEAEAVAKGPVEDRMVPASGAPAGNWQGIARFAILQVAGLDEGKAELSDHALTVRGEAMDDTRRAELTEAVYAVAAPFKGVAVIRGTPVWQARREADGLVLSGTVPSEADHAGLLALARRLVPGEVRDEMAVAPMPASGWVESAKAGLIQFAGFETGSMAFDPPSGGFIFEGEAPASTLQFLEQDMARMAGTWRYVIAAEAVQPGLTEAAGGAATASTPTACEEDLNKMLSSAAVSFEPGLAEFSRSSAPALDQFAAIAQRCKTLELAVDDDALNAARAGAIADFLERGGAQRPRLAAIGYGPAAGGRAKDAGAGLTSIRPLEFTTRERSGQ